VKDRPKSVFKHKKESGCLSSFHDKYVVSPADKLLIQCKCSILFFFVKVITMSVKSKNLTFPRTLVILLTKL